MSTANTARSTDQPLDGDVDGVVGLKQRIRERATELVENGGEALDDMRSNLRERVSDRPFTSLAVAGGIGLLLGLLIARKR